MNAVVDTLVALCQKVLEVPVLAHAEKEHLYSLLDDSVMNLHHGTIATITDHLQTLGIHEELLLDRDAYEYTREVALAKAIIDVGDQSPLENFRSTQWYHDAHCFENAALAQYSPTNILMVGCGPFPSTALSLMDSFPDANLVCLDKDTTAYHLATEVVEIFGHKLYGGCVDVLKLPGWTLKQYDCVLVGTVVGVRKQEKSDIVNYFLHGVTPGTTLAVRTATGPGEIIYPTVDLDLFNDLDYRVLPNPPQKTWTTILMQRSL